MSATVERRFHLGTQGNRRGGFRRVLRSDAVPEEAFVAAEVATATPTTAPPRVHPLARRMAMAIRCAQLIDSGVVSDQAAVASIAGVTRAWVTMVMRLNALAPDIQQALLNLDAGSEVDRRTVQLIAMGLSWQEQRAQWRLLRAPTSLAHTL